MGKNPLFFSLRCAKSTLLLQLGKTFDLRVYQPFLIISDNQVTLISELETYMTINNPYHIHEQVKLIHIHAWRSHHWTSSGMAHFLWSVMKPTMPACLPAYTCMHTYTYGQTHSSDVAPHLERPCCVIASEEVVAWHAAAQPTNTRNRQKQTK